MLFCSAREAAAQAGYKNLTDFVIDIQALAASNAASATAFRLVDSSNSLIWTEGESRRRIWCLKITAGANPSRKLLVTGTHHAREWVAYRAVWDAAQFILTNRYATNWNNVSDSGRFTEFALFKEMNLNALVSNAHIFMIPIENPSGYYYSKEVAGDPVPDDPNLESSWGWRKNRMSVTNYPVAPGETNSAAPLIGVVDLNRNYPSLDWGKETLHPSGLKTTSRWRRDDVYCGKPSGGAWTVPSGSPQPAGPTKEKETEGIVALSSANEFDCHIDVHSTGGSVGWVQEADTSSANLRPTGGLTDSNVLPILGAKAAALISDPDIGGSYDPEASPCFSWRPY
jgi:hypothetical protein